MSHLIEYGIPPLHRDWDIKDMVGADNLEAVQHGVIKFITDLNVIKDGNCLYIYSVENGTGKTRTANFILYQLHKPRLDEKGNGVIIPILSVMFGEYLRFCKDTFGEDSKEARRIVMMTPILLLDDVSPVFSLSNVQNDRAELLMLMAYRRNHKLVTVITSNLTPDEFQKLYGPSASSKVLENFSFIQVIGGDVRQAIYPDQLQESDEPEDDEACR